MFPDWLNEQVTDEERAVLQQCLAAFADPSTDRTSLVKAASSVEEIEKRLILLNPEQLVMPDLKNRVLVCSVGLRPMPVILTALITAPQKLYLLHTSDSRPVAEMIRDDPSIQRLGLDPINEILLKEISLTDAPYNYNQLRQIIQENPKQKIVVDISGGVKVMGTSLASAAFWLRIPVIYQLAEEVNGIVRPFSAHLMQLENPFAFFGSTELRSIQDLFHSGDYDAALALSTNLREDVGDVTTLGRLDILLEFIRIYRDWDAFIHSGIQDTPERKLAGRLRALAAKLKRMNLQFVPIPKLEENIAFLQMIENGWIANSRSLNDMYRLVDIFVSAKRRADAGKYDDAVGRLYRCLEMCASITLSTDCNLTDPKEPNLTHFIQITGSNDAFASRFKEKAQYEFPQGRPLGLKDQMVLLTLSRDSQHITMGHKYLDMESEGLIEKRNRSILAHGTVSVTKEEYEAFSSRSRVIIDRAIRKKGEFDRLCALATHPQISIEL